MKGRQIAWRFKLDSNRITAYSEDSTCPWSHNNSIRDNTYAVEYLLDNKLIFRNQLK